MFGVVSNTTARVMVLESQHQNHESGCTRSWDQNSKDLSGIRDTVSATNNKLDAMQQDVNEKHTQNKEDMTALKNRLIIAGLLILLAVFANGKGFDLAKALFAVL